MLTTIHHVQLAIPEGEEDAARAFYGDVLGLSEVPKPESLIKRGGCWFQCGDVKVHLGIMEDFCPATKAHPAFVVSDLSDMRQRCDAAGCVCIDGDPLDGFARFHVSDPFGNRIELMQLL
ncbi:glyoxalase [Tateyamaria omphalii]|uniref:VOC family protein n=1 Tax=Tateyamaria omphalii TaxID=299262 RepID=UPI00167C035A|nr:VOC family protein [Tateyamaria omphalii]GGX46081.1 glyoxalase [Tateyamaria omphalii]